MALRSCRIPGPAILGLGDIFVGGPPPPKKPTIVVRIPPAAAKAPPGGKTAPAGKAPPSSDLRLAKSPQKGRTFVALVPQKGKTHEDSIKKARQVADRAASIAKAASGLAKKASAQIVQKTVVGAVAPKHAAGAHLHAVRIAQAAKDVADRAKKLGTNAKTHQGTVTTGKQRQQQAVKTQKAAYGPSGKPGVPVHVGGAERLPPRVVGAVLDAYYTAVGAWPDPDRPGLLDDGSLDPIIAVGDDGTLPAADPGAPPIDPGVPPMDPGAADAALDPADPTYGLGPPPTSAPPFVAGQDYMPGAGYPLDAVLSFPLTDPADPNSGLPLGAIVYDPKRKPWGWQSVGSYSRFNPVENAMGGPGSGFQWGGGNPGILDGWYWFWRSAFGPTQYKHENAGNSIREAGNYGAGPETEKRRAEVSSQLGWGPLIGNPNDADFKNLRYDTAGGRWFWFYDEAPAWAKALDPLVGDGMRLQKAILDYNTQITAAKADALQAAMQDKADQKEAQDLARQQAKQDAQAAIQQSQQQTQQQQAEAAAESQQKIAAMQQETQANALLLQQAQQQLTQATEAPGGYDGGGSEDEGPRMDTSAYADEYADEYADGYGDEYADGYADEYADEGTEPTAVGAAGAANVAAAERALVAAKRIAKRAPRLAAVVAKAGQKALAAGRGAVPVRPRGPAPAVRRLSRPAPRARVGDQGGMDVYASLADAAASGANLVAQIQDLMAQLPQELPLTARGQKIIAQYELLFGTPIENILSGLQDPMAGVQGMAETIDRLTGQMQDPKTPIGAWVANVSAYLRVHPPQPQQDPEGGWGEEGSAFEDAGASPIEQPSRGAGAFG